MANQQIDKDRSQTVPMPGQKLTQELTDTELATVTGGTRDVSTGMATGKRMHKPIAVSAAGEPSSEE